MLQASHIFENGYLPLSALSEINATFSEKALHRWLKKLGDGNSDALSKYWQRHMRIEIVDELWEIVDQKPYCMSRYLVNRSNNTVLNQKLFPQP